MNNTIEIYLALSKSGYLKQLNGSFSVFLESGIYKLVIDRDNDYAVYNGTVIMFSEDGHHWESINPDQIFINKPVVVSEYMDSMAIHRLKSDPLEKWNKELQSLGWEKSPKPDWIRYEPMFIPDEMWRFKSNPPELVWMDDFEDVYYLNYDDSGYYQIYRHRQGGFAGVNVNFPVFYGRSGFGNIYNEMQNEDRVKELKHVMKLVGVK